jgi:hypothetical protein
VDDLKPVGLDGAARLGDFHGGIGDALHHLCLGGAPGIIDFDIDIALGEIPPGKIHQLRREPLAGKVLDLFVRAVPRDDDNPASRPAAYLGIGEFLDPGHVRIVLEYPVPAGNAGVQDPVLNELGHLLRPHQGAVQFVVVHGRKVVSRSPVDPPSSFAKQFDSGFFKAPLGDTKLEPPVAVFKQCVLFTGQVAFLSGSVGCFTFDV